MYKIVIALCLVATALASSDYNDRHNDGYGYVGHHGGYYTHEHARNRDREAHVNYYNGQRQHAVNAAAEHYGAGTGTAAYYGVPGTSVGVHGHRYGGYGYGGHGYGYH